VLAKNTIKTTPPIGHPSNGGKCNMKVNGKGTPEEVAKNKKSYTAQFLKKELI
jgi:excinuclease UvrABC ATPase subunit